MNVFIYMWFKIYICKLYVYSDVYYIDVRRFYVFQVSSHDRVRKYPQHLENMLGNQSASQAVA